LEAQYQKLREAVFSAEETLAGKRSRNGMGTPPASIASRLFMLEFARANTWGLTATQQQQMVYIQDGLKVLQPQIDSLFNREFPMFKQVLLEAGAPWLPQGIMQDTASRAVEID
jgi:hypothetical protein